MGGKFHLKLNMDGRPIANKYREGKMKRTLKREWNSTWNCWKGTDGKQWYALWLPTAYRSGFLLRKGKDIGADSALWLCHAKERLWQNASHQPVLKHGPRSLTCVRVLGSDSPARNESKGFLRRTEVGSCISCTIDRPWSFEWKVWVWAYMLGPERWWTMPE
jgi:hypothetical protein